MPNPENDIIETLEKGYATILMGILFPYLNADENSSPEKIAADWSSLQAITPSYIAGNERNNPHAVVGVLKFFLHMDEKVWKAAESGGDEAEVLKKLILFPEETGEKIQAVIDEFHSARIELLKTPSENSQVPNLIGRNPHWLKLLETACRIAPVDVPVILCGETGTGKERVAEYIHFHSRRKTGDFTAVNCGALPENLIYSELFGYEPGSFTGSSKSGHKGRLEAANKGTFLLDDIDALPMNAQAALLRFIETGEIQKVGASVSPKIDLRIICTTNRNLLQMAEQKLFRRDLYYRLSVFKLEIPPLRERKDDIPLFALHYLRKLLEAYPDHRLIAISDSAKNKLCGYDWPGNLREFQSVVWRAAMDCKDGIIWEEHIKFDNRHAVSPDIKGAESVPPDLHKKIMELPFTLQERQKLTVFISAMSGIFFSAGDFAGFMEISTSGARVKLNTMVEKGLLKAQGKNRGRKYRVIYG